MQSTDRISPVIGSHWWFGGHLLLQQCREWILGVAVPTAYLLLLDTSAIREGVWRLSDTHITSVQALGIPLEHLALYTITTALVVLPLVTALRFAELRWQCRSRATVSGSWPDRRRS